MKNKRKSGLKGKKLVLGTAMWGWTIEKKECLKILDYFYEKGFRCIDTASNYPINNKTNYFRYSENILKEWISHNKISDLEIYVKIGSTDNSGNSFNNLSFSFLLMNYQYYIQKFGRNLKNFMVHWDNRDSVSSIHLTIKALEIIKSKGVDIGLSGIKNPNIYYETQRKSILNCTFQLKHNIFSSDFERYSMFNDKGKFLVYGINGGGIKLNNIYNEKSNIIVRKKLSESIRRETILKNLKQKIIRNFKSSFWNINNFNHIAMIHAYNTSWVNGIIVGPSNLIKLKDTVLFYDKLVKNDSFNIYKIIINTFN